MSFQYFWLLYLFSLVQIWSKTSPVIYLKVQSLRISLTAASTSDSEAMETILTYVFTFNAEIIACGFTE